MNYFLQKRKWTLLTQLLFVFFYSGAQDIIPGDGFTFNHTQIMFEVPYIDGAAIYRFSISKCDKRAEKCETFALVKSASRAVLIDNVFEFGNTYKWTYSVIDKKKKVLYTSKEYVLYTGTSNLLDTNLQKLVYTIPNKSRSKGVIFIDGMKLAVNMQGKPLLYLNYKHDHAVRDINLTKQGTITMIDNRLGEVKELKLTGELLWIGPTKYESEEKRSEKYHHEMEKLKSGNYLVAGKKKVSEYDLSSGLEGVPNDVLSENIIEFDKDLNEVWRFDLLLELKRQYNIVPTGERFSLTRLGHLNGMAVDEKRNIVYASFKTFNTVMKIEKQSNNILYMYGLKKINFKDSTEKGLAFEQQHCPAFHENGNLLIYNNGNDSTGSGIVELNTKAYVDSSNEVVRSLYFKNFLSKDYYNVQMGSVQYLEKNKLLVGMGNLPHFFEMDFKSGKILWQAYTYTNTRWEENGKKWKPLVNYRVFYYSSLYPYYFVADYSKSKNQIQLHNPGSEIDTYRIYGIEQDKSEEQFLKAITIKSLGSNLFTPDKEKKYSQFKVVSVASGKEVVLMLN